MFLDQELKNIQEAKSRLAICCDLRRHLVHIEIQGWWRGGRRAFSTMILGLTVAEQVLSFLRERKARRR